MDGNENVVYLTGGSWHLLLVCHGVDRMHFVSERQRESGYSTEAYLPLATLNY